MLFRSDDKDAQNTLYYNYIIEASVTSLAGETQSAIFSMNAGSRSMLINAGLPELVLKSDSLQTTITAYNLNHQAVAASGEFLLYPIKYGQSAADAKKSEPAYSAPFTAHEVTSLAAWNNLPSGKYLIVTQANDSEGKLVTYETEITLFALTDKHQCFSFTKLFSFKY